MYTDLFNRFVIGIAFTNAGWKYYFLYIFWDILEFAVIYFLFVETSNRTLEELTWIFRQKKPVKASLQQGSIALASVDGHTVVLEKEGQDSVAHEETVQE